MKFKVKVKWLNDQRLIIGSHDNRFKVTNEFRFKVARKCNDVIDIEGRVIEGRIMGINRSGE